MLLRDYVAALQEMATATPFVTATALSYEERPPSAGLIKGSLIFADGSQLEFKEVVITQPTLRVIKYGYHQPRASHLHRPPSTLPAQRRVRSPLFRTCPASLTSEHPSRSS